MNRYEFENLISDYLDGELSFSKRKEFESYLEENEDAKSLFFRVKNTLNDMKNAEKISTPENFNSKLLSKIKDKSPLIPNQRSSIFGLSPLHASFFSSCASSFLSLFQQCRAIEVMLLLQIQQLNINRIYIFAHIMHLICYLKSKIKVK